MSLNQQIMDDLKTAMKSKDQFLVDTIRMLRAAVKNEEIQKGGKLTDEDILGVLGSEAKKRKESAVEYKNAERLDLAASEEKELEIIQKYLPAQLTKDELQVKVNIAFEAFKPVSSGDMGKIMGMLMKDLKGIADGRLVQELVKQKFESVE